MVQALAERKSFLEKVAEVKVLSDKEETTSLFWEIQGGNFKWAAGQVAADM